MSWATPAINKLTFRFQIARRLPMGLFNLLKASVKLAVDVVDGTVDTTLDLVQFDHDALAKRIDNVPDRVSKFFDDATEDED